MSWGVFVCAMQDYAELMMAELNQQFPLIGLSRADGQLT
jgi:hypothetical protein